MIRLFTWIGFLIGAGLVFYLSWVPNPDIGYIIPVGTAQQSWINNNGNIRTAIPFVALGLWIEIGLHHRLRFLSRLGYWFLLLGIVIVAELGQLMLPQRHPDWGDIGWGALGSTLGMGLGWLISLGIKHWQKTK